MFVETVESSISLPDGNALETVGYGLILNVEGVETVVSLKDLVNVQLDNENSDEARLLYVTYNNQDYQFDLPPRASRDWAILEELFHPE